jgi:biotin synthase
MTDWNRLASDILGGTALTRNQAREILEVPEGDMLSLLSGASRLRQAHFGKRVKLNYLVNVKSGLCPEDCNYCSQSKVSEAPIPKYPLMPAEEIIANAERGMAVGAVRACLVASGRGPSNRELNEFCGSVEKLKDRYPSLEVCACLGLLSDGQAGKLKDSGVHAYNHNINTSESHYAKICDTHTYNDRIDTVDKAQTAGLSSCSGVLAGMGETDEDLVDMAFVLREKKVHSVPVNFLVSIDKTPLANTNNLTPWRCLKILCLFRFANPGAELRISGGREVHLRHLQPFGLTVANSIFIGDYLTTEGQSPTADLEMIRDLGYTVEGQADDFLARVLGGPASSAPLKTRELAAH